MENHIQPPELHIGVTKRRKCSIGTEKTRAITSLALLGVVGGDEYLYFDGVGIKSCDYFQFYYRDQNAALAACHNVSINLRNLKLHSNAQSCLRTRGCAANNILIIRRF